MPARRPPREVSLHDFLAGLFAGLALKDVHRFEAAPPVLAAAIDQTIQSAKPVQDRLRLKLTFRSPDTESPTFGPTFKKALARLDREGILHREGNIWTIPLDRVTAAVVFEEITTPLDYHARCVRVFQRAIVTSRVRWSLARLAQGGKPTTRT